MNEKIDFVVTWLDSDDPVWKEEYIKYKYGETKGDCSEVRFRNWGLFRYWFRAVEKYAPWVNKVFLVTNGKFPDWINEKCEKLVLIKHSDYIPEKFLPTFNSCTIELHMNKIPGLSEQFVYFNDDFYLNNPVRPKYFFKNGLPCDNNAETVFNVPIYDNDDKFGISMSVFTNIAVINKNFNRWYTVKQSPRKWLGCHLSFKERMLSLNLARQRKFVGFRYRHFEQPFLKSVIDEVWKKEPDMLLQSCTRFREEIILNPYFFRFWQFASNRFTPIKLAPHRSTVLKEYNIPQIKNMLSDSKIPSFCLNDIPNCTQEEFERTKNSIIELFENKLPNISQFEKASLL